MRLISHTSAYKLESKLLEADRDRQTMFRMGSVRAQDNSRGVSGIEPERTARYQDLLYARMEYDVTALIRIGPGAYGTPRRKGSRGANRPHRNTWWPPNES